MATHVCNQPILQSNLAIRAYITPSAPAWSNIPLHVLHQEIQRRQEAGERPACGSGASKHAYNTPLHVFALFLILILSTAACSFPVVVRRFPNLPVPSYALFLSRHFGTGVLIATAFVHLLPTAYTSLTDPCLPPFWTDVYPAMPGFIAMVSVMVVVGIEMFFALKGASHSHSVDLDGLREEGGQAKRPGHKRTESFRPFRQVPLGQGSNYGQDGVPLEDQSRPYVDEPMTPGSVLDKPLPPEPPRDSEDDSDLDLDELDPHADSDTRPLNGFAQRKRSSSEASNGLLHPNHHTGHGHDDYASPSSDHNPQSNPTTNDANEKRLILQCLLLEAGILFHSVFIGLALSVSTGPAFIVLLIAIAFHQTFEGLALGSRIAGVSSFSTTSLKPWIMSLMYGITTPVGQAIGLGVHGLYDPASQVGLLTVGIVNAVSSGLLLYAGLVQLLAEDFLSDASYAELQGKRRLQACGAVVAGSMLMAFVGAFA
jgi:zinc transporter 1/2/3